MTWCEQLTDFYVNYLCLSHRANEILSDMWRVRFLDWKIHSRLKAAKIVYIQWPRGNGKHLTLSRQIQALVDAGYDVRPMPKSGTSTIRKTFVDRDVLTPDRYERADSFIRKCLGEQLRIYAARFGTTSITRSGGDI
jgi:hypothetical protein